MITLINAITSTYVRIHDPNSIRIFRIRIVGLRIAVMIRIEFFGSDPDPLTALIQTTSYISFLFCEEKNQTNIVHATRLHLIYPIPVSE